MGVPTRAVGPAGVIGIKVLLPHLPDPEETLLPVPWAGLLHPLRPGPRQTPETRVRTRTRGQSHTRTSVSNTPGVKPQTSCGFLLYLKVYFVFIFFIIFIMLVNFHLYIFRLDFSYHVKFLCFLVRFFFNKQTWFRKYKNNE